MVNNTQRDDLQSNVQGVVDRFDRRADGLDLNTANYVMGQGTSQPVNQIMQLIDQYTQRLVLEGRSEAAVKAENYGRVNEHHVISQIMTNEDIAALSPATVRRLKQRKAELEQLDKLKEEK